VQGPVGPVGARGECAAAGKELQERKKDLEELKARMEAMEKLISEIGDINKKIEHYNSVREMTAFMRSLLNRAGERISAVYREHMAREADRIYREVSRENVSLEWREDYEVFLMDTLNGRQRSRSFRQLSGGEQMTAALAMRLALLRQLSGSGIGFFDEPTTNLDVERRGNLAQILPQVTGTFDQLFVISHDDSFDSMTENIVQLKKDSGEGTKLV
jgi:exonuclease SbcC